MAYVMPDGYYWVRPIVDGPWVIHRWDMSSDGDCGWLGKPYDWNPAEVGERIPDNDTLRWWRGL